MGSQTPTGSGGQLNSFLFFFQKRAKREDATRFQCQSIDTSVRELPQKENERAISEDFPAADIYGNLVSLFKNLEGKPIS